MPVLIVLIHVALGFLLPVSQYILNVFVVCAFAHWLALLSDVPFLDQLCGRPRLIDGLILLFRTVAAAHFEGEGLLLDAVHAGQVKEAVEALRSL